MTPAVGADIESLCSKCGDVWHVVVAKVGDEIAKVECKECHGVHRYRPPKGKAVARPVGRRKTGGASTKSSASKPRRKSTPIIETIEADPSKPLREYKISETYEPGERIDHPRFGIGVAQRSPGVGKIEVLFADGARVLMQAKPTGGLQPRRVSFDD